MLESAAMGGSPAILVAGADPLGLAVIERLARSGVEITALVSEAEASSYRLELERLSVRVVVGSARSPGELLAAGADGVTAVVLTADDDSENVDAALAARRLRPDLPLVVRLFDEALAAYLRDTLPGVSFLSMSSVSAPFFAELASRAMASSGASRPAPRRRRLRRRMPVLDRVTLAAGLSAILLVVAATAYFARALDLRTIDALYFVWTTVFTVGYGDITPHRASDAAKIAAMLLMVGGAGLITVLYALLSGWVVSRRLDVLRGRVRVRESGHVIVAGAGNVGYRVASILADRGRRIVVVERDADNPNLARLRAAGHHVVVADATADETLELAGVERAATVLALTDSDATNLHVVLGVHACRPGLPVVTRLASPELSAHLTDRDGALAASSIAIGSDAFVSATLAACGMGPGSSSPPGIGG